MSQTLDTEEEVDVEKGLPSHDRGSNPKDKATPLQQRDGSGLQRITFARILVVVIFILQIHSAVLGQLNSNPKRRYALMLMSLSHATLLIWIIELVLRARGLKERVIWKRGKLVPLLYPSSTTNNKPFFSSADIVGLLSAVCQSIITTVNYALLVRHINAQIQISGWPIISAFVLLCSRFQADQTKTNQSDQVQLDSTRTDAPRSKYPKGSTLLQDFKATFWRYVSCSQITSERGIAIINFILELPSAVLDQLSSEPKPVYALILWLLSFASLLLCIFEVVHRGKHEKVTWTWKWRGKVLWLYPNKPFFCFDDKVGLICAVVQPIFTTVNYALVLRHGSQFQIAVLPIAFTLVLSCSKICDGPNKMTKRDVLFLKTDSVEIAGQEEKSVLQENKIARPNLRGRKMSILPKTWAKEETGWVATWEETADELKNMYEVLLLKGIYLSPINEIDRLIMEGEASPKLLEWEWQWVVEKSNSKAEKIWRELFMEMFKSLVELKETALVLSYVGIGSPNITLGKLKETSAIIEDRHWVEQVETYLEELVNTLKTFEEFERAMKYLKLKVVEKRLGELHKLPSYKRDDELEKAVDLLKKLKVEKHLDELKNPSPFIRYKIILQGNILYHMKEVLYLLIHKELSKLKKLWAMKETYWFLLAEEHKKKILAMGETYWLAKEPNLEELKRRISAKEDTKGVAQAKSFDEVKNKIVLQKETLDELRMTLDELMRQNAFLVELLDEAKKGEKMKESERRKEIERMGEPTGRKTVNVLRRRLRRL